MLKTSQVFFPSMDTENNESEFFWYQPFRHLKMINTQSQTHRPNDFILSSSSIFFSTWITPVALGSLQIVKPFPTEQSWAPDKALLLEPQPCQVQWIIPPGALGRRWCMRSPWVPVPCLQHCHRTQALRNLFLCMMLCLLHNTSLQGLSRLALTASAWFHSKVKLWTKVEFSPDEVLPFCAHRQLSACQQGCLNLATPEVWQGLSA